MPGHSTGQEASRAPRPPCVHWEARQVTSSLQWASGLISHTRASPPACCPRKQGGSRAGYKAPSSFIQAGREDLLGLQQRGAPVIPSYTGSLPSVSQKRSRGDPYHVPGSKVPHPPPTNPGEDRPDSRFPLRGLRTTSPLFLLTLPLPAQPTLYTPDQPRLHPYRTSHRAAGNSWCIAQGHLAQGDSTHILDLCIYYNCLHFEGGTPSSIRTKMSWGG